MMETFLRYAVVIVISYLFGSFNFAIIVSRYMKKEDVREHGSGSAGLTNYFRNYGGMSTLIVGAGDILKCVLATRVSGYIFLAEGDPYFGVLLSGLFVMIGHIFPLYFGFRGGKGVLTMAALFLIFDWRALTVAVAVFIIIVALTRYVSLGSMAAVGLAPILIFLLHGGRAVYLFFTALTAGIVIFMHRSNIRRLLKGSESKLVFRRDTK